MLCIFILQKSYFLNSVTTQGIFKILPLKLPFLVCQKNINENGTYSYISNTIPNLKKKTNYANFNVSLNVEPFMILKLISIQNKNHSNKP